MIYAVMTYSLITIILAIWAYRQGMRDGMRKDTGQAPEKQARRHRAVPETEDDARINAIMANVDAYDGTGAGQRKVM